jgi:hypothetical protein
LRDVQRFIEQLARINFPQLLVRAQMPFAVRETSDGPAAASVQR